METRTINDAFHGRVLIHSIHSFPNSEFLIKALPPSQSDNLFARRGGADHSNTFSTWFIGFSWTETDRNVNKDHCWLNCSLVCSSSVPYMPLRFWSTLFVVLTVLSSTTPVPRWFPKTEDDTLNLEKKEPKFSRLLRCTTLRKKFSSYYSIQLKTPRSHTTTTSQPTTRFFRPGALSFSTINQSADTQFVFVWTSYGSTNNTITTRYHDIVGDHNNEILKVRFGDFFSLVAVACNNTRRGSWYCTNNNQQQ